MEKQELKKQLEDKVKVLKTQCKDARFADVLIGDILSLKGQMDVEPASVFVGADIDSEIKQSAYHIFRTKPYKETVKGIDITTDKETEKEVFHAGKIVFAINGYKVIISEQLDMYHFPFNALLQAHDEYDKLTEQEKKSYEDLLSNVCLAMQMPTMIFSNPELYQKIMNVYIPCLNKMVEDAMNAPLQPDDEQKNEEFKEKVEFAENLKQDDNKENV
jgi:hypothetical protein